MEITFLGTSAGIPTKDRNTTAIHLKFLGNSLLFDCGEGTQRQMMKAGLSIQKISHIFISHIHADHLLGLAGLIQTMGFNSRTKELHIYAPKEARKYVNFFKKWDYLNLGYEIKFHSLKQGTILETQEFKIKAVELKHGIPCYGFVFEEKVEVNLDKKKLKKYGLKESPLLKELKKKGKIKFKGKTVYLKDVSTQRRKPKKISIIMDTKPFEKLAEEVKESDVFICEATHMDELKQKSHEYGHMTAKDAATTAKKAGVKKLIITHFSSRYKDAKELQKEAKKIFKETEAAEDFYTIQL